MNRICSGIAAIALVFATGACAVETGAETGMEGIGPELVRVGDMSVARAAHQATRLPSGKVLVTGGCSGQCDVTLDSVEIFDPGTRRFETLASMAVPRNSHAAVTLDDGRVLLLGGWNDRQVTDSAEIFDPATGRFATIANMGTERAVPAAVKLADGRVLVTGGQTTGMVPLDSAEVFDPATGAFSAVAGMGSPRLSHVAVALADGRVLVAGGVPARRGQVLRTAEIFDPGTGRFTPVGDMAVPRYKFAAVRLADGKVLMVGGAGRDSRDARYRSTELFDPATGRFSPGPDMQEPRYKHPDGALLLASGDVLVAAGSSRVERFDAGSRSFVVLPGEMEGAKEFATATLLDNGDVLVIGGYGVDIQTSAATWLVRNASGD